MAALDDGGETVECCRMFHPRARCTADVAKVMRLKETVHSHSRASLPVLPQPVDRAMCVLPLTRARIQSGQLQQGGVMPSENPDARTPARARDGQPGHVRPVGT
jgi:hypothetical protein